MKKAIRFTAKWCQPCKAYTPVWDDVKQEYTEWEWEVVDVTSDVDSTKKYNVTSIPATIIEVDGEVVDRKAGLLNKPDLRKLIEAHNK